MEEMDSALDYDLIARECFEQYKTLFVNLIRKNFVIDYDRAMDLYSDVWVDLRDGILSGRVAPDSNLRALILKMGWNQAAKLFRNRSRSVSFDDERFDPDKFEQEYRLLEEEDKDFYKDPDLVAVLETELSYIPEPCSKVLEMKYSFGCSMKEIADAMNYRNERSAISAAARCREKLRNRMMKSLKLLGFID